MKPPVPYSGRNRESSTNSGEYIPPAWVLIPLRFLQACGKYNGSPFNVYNVFQENRFQSPDRPVNKSERFQGKPSGRTKPCAERSKQRNNGRKRKPY